MCACWERTTHQSVSMYTCRHTHGGPRSGSRPLNAPIRTVPPSLKLNKSKCTLNFIKKTNPPPDPNSNYNTLCNDMLRSKNKQMPSKLVKVNKYKDTHSSWITQGLLKSIKYRDNLYKRLQLTYPKSANYDTIDINLHKS